MHAVVAAGAFHVAVTAGLGAAHGLAGPQLELRFDHMCVYGGFGMLNFRYPEQGNSADADLSPAFGARWLSGDGEGLYVSVHAAYIADRTQLNAIDYYAAERTVLGLTLGGRLRFWEGAFLDLGAGPGIQFRHEHSYYDAKAYERRFVRFGIVANMPLPDLELALGYEF